MGSYSAFQIHSARDSGANISHAAVVLPMSPLPWKRCIRGSGKAGCPLLIGRQGGRSVFLSPRLPCIFLLDLVLFPPLNTCSIHTCQNPGAPAEPSWHVLNTLTTFKKSSTVKNSILNVVVYGPIRHVCVRTDTHTWTFRSMRCVVCHTPLWEALAGFREDSASLNSQWQRVQDCMTWPSIQARQCCVYIPGGWERQRNGGGGRRVKKWWPWRQRQDSLSSVSSLPPTLCLLWRETKKTKDGLRTWSHFRVRSSLYPNISKQHNNTLSHIPVGMNIDVISDLNISGLLKVAYFPME